MSTLSGILEMSKRALMAHQMISNVIGNNVANVNTPGYSRQSGELVPSPAVHTPWGPLGTGVDVSQVRRHRDAFLDQQYRGSVGKQAHWSVISRSLSEIEAMFNDPGDSGLQAALDDFWNAWSDLANDPENSTARTVVREKGQALTRAFHRIASYLRDHIEAVDREARKLVQDANELLRQVADLNGKIKTLQAQGGSANELKDQRDRLLDQLAELVGARSIESSDGTVRVLVGTEVLVEATRYSEIQMADEGRNGLVLAEFVGPSGQELDPPESKLSGLLQLRDETLQGYLDDLDAIASNLVREVNLRHRQGYTLDGSKGGDFFDATTLTAADIRLDNSIVQDVNNIVASRDENPGNNDIALAIASLRWQKVMNDGTDSLLEYYSGLIGRVGSLAAEAEDAVANQELITETLDNQRLRVQGVSLDEEMAELIKFQHAYQASAQVVTAVDEMMRTVLAMVR